jgi:hypothetical protein
VGLFKSKKRNGTQLFAFFAANDAQLSSWLNRQSSGEQGVIIATLDAALSAPNRELFEKRLLDLYGQYMDADEGSDHEARLNAMTRMLGYEYEKAYKGDMKQLVGHFYSLIDSGDETEQPDTSNIFGNASMALIDAARESDDILEQDKKLSSACVLAAAAVLTAITQGRDVDSDSDWTAQELMRIVSSEDLLGAARAVSAVSWYFALFFVRPSMNSFDEDTCVGWLAAMHDALAPTDDVRLAELQDISDLYDNYKAIRDEENRNFPLQFVRWLNINLGARDETTLISSMHLMNACQHLRESFREDLVQQGLLSRVDP